ncbi:F-box only protein 47 [Lepeophtheirus salmonis]|uniref:F-box only protein 47 n=1 Tax=Lepeophtheirus salmonis TaxID=72036 RepID=UPI001AE453A3|nr:uncharacterized protein LOC121128679 [Lepeophtheirus salmonis]
MPLRTDNDVFRRRPLAIPPSSSIGEFERLPLEVTYILLEWIPLDQLGNLALTSERMRVLLSNWTMSPHCLKRASLTSARLCSFSILCKRVTSLLNTRERIKFMMCRFHESLILRSSEVKDIIPRIFSRQINQDHLVDYFIHFGLMLTKFISGWDPREYKSLFQALDQLFLISVRINKYMDYITSSSFQENLSSQDACVQKDLQDTEKQLRLITRSLWWDMSDNSEYSFCGDWLLANILHYIGSSPAKQGIIIYLMFGPTLSHWETPSVIDENNDPTFSKRMLRNDLFSNINWDFMINHTPINFPEGKKVFNRIAQCVCHLSQSCRLWRKTSLIELLDKLFQFPNEWMRDNVSGFLLFCNERVILDYINNKLDRAALLDIQLEIPAKLLVDIMIESYKFDNRITNVKGIGSVVDRVLSYTNHDLRSEFFDCIWDLLLNEIEESRDNIPIEEVIVGFGRFISKRSIYGVSKRKVVFSEEDQPKRKRDDSGTEDETCPNHENEE